MVISSVLIACYLAVEGYYLFPIPFIIALGVQGLYLWFATARILRLNLSFLSVRNKSTKIFQKMYYELRIMIDHKFTEEVNDKLSYAVETYIKGLKKFNSAIFKQHYFLLSSGFSLVLFGGGIILLLKNQIFNKTNSPLKEDELHFFAYVFFSIVYLTSLTELLINFEDCVFKKASQPSRQDSLLSLKTFSSSKIKKVIKNSTPLTTTANITPAISTNPEVTSKDRNDPPKINIELLSNLPRLKIENLNFSVLGEQILSEFNLEIRRNQVIGILSDKKENLMALMLLLSGRFTTSKPNPKNRK